MFFLSIKTIFVGKKSFFLISQSLFLIIDFHFVHFFSGPDEERCAGSILLPSYKISPVGKEDGVYKKFAFKAEHQVRQSYLQTQRQNDNDLYENN